jgi:hypothetical protein
VGGSVELDKPSSFKDAVQNGGGQILVSNSGGHTGGGRGRGGFSQEDYRESARQPREPRW